MIKIPKAEKTRLIVTYANNRAAKDEHNRKRGLQRLEKRIKSGKLTKSNINNKGYNKYLKMQGDVTIEIDYEKFWKDNAWDGLKGYVTNTELSDKLVVENYKNLWHIEKAFRMSKTDLRIRPFTTDYVTGSKPISASHLRLTVSIRNWKGCCTQKTLLYH